MGQLFGTDGIRGEVNRYPMNSAIAFSVGQAITFLLRKPDHQPRIIIGKDTRISGYMLENSLEAGIPSMGQVEKELSESGRVLVGASGTQNVCHVIIKNPSKEVTEKYCKQIAEVMQTTFKYKERYSNVDKSFRNR